MRTLTLPDRRGSSVAHLARAAVVLLCTTMAACGGGATEPRSSTDAQLHLRDLAPPGTLSGSLSFTFAAGGGYVPAAPFRKKLDVKGASPSVKWLTFFTNDNTVPKDIFGGSFMSNPLREQRIETGAWQLLVAGDRSQVGDHVELQAALFTAYDAGGGRYQRRATIADLRTITGYNFCYGNMSSRILTIPGAAVSVHEGDVLVLELWAVLANRNFAHGPSSVLRLTYDGDVDGATEGAGGCGTGSLNNDSRLEPPHPLRF